MRQRFERGVERIGYEFTAVRKDGITFEAGVNYGRATLNGKRVFIGLMQDISEKLHARDLAKRHMAQLESAFMGTVQVAMNLSEMRDAYTHGHARRVGEIAAAIGAELGFDEQRQQGLRVAGYLHDIGKISAPMDILNKTEALSSRDMGVIRRHAEAGYNILKGIDLPWPVAEVTYQHHERMDGSGYPRGLRGVAILLESRIVMVADVVESMASPRPYREALGITRALEEIERGSGSAYDAAVSHACLRLFREKGYVFWNDASRHPSPAIYCQRAVAV